MAVSARHTGTRGRFEHATSGSLSPDIVDKVKPAVISVRVKIVPPRQPAAIEQNGEDDETIPFAPGSPLDKFFQQFGRQFGDQDGQHGQNGQNGTPRNAIRPSPARARASSSRPTATR